MSIDTGVALFVICAIRLNETVSQLDFLHTTEPLKTRQDNMELFVQNFLWPNFKPYFSAWQSAAGFESKTAE
jgi:hypothetical protein